MNNKKKSEPFSAERPQKKHQLSKHKKPKFKRQESWRYERVKEKWRKSRGIDSKMRKKVKGWPPSPAAGYRSPKKTRALHPSGYLETQARTVEDLNGIDSAKQSIRIARTVGGRKRVEILALAEERGIHVLNPRTVREPEEIEEEEMTEEEEQEREREETR